MAKPSEIFKRWVGRRAVEPPKPDLNVEYGQYKCPACSKLCDSILKLAGHIMGSIKDKSHKKYKPWASYVLVHRFDGDERLREIYQKIGRDITTL